MNNSGWIAIHRKIQDHWLYPKNRAFTKYEAWLDLLMEANHKENKVNLGNKLLLVKRGETIKSLDTWARRWNWNKSKVRRFTILLQNDNMIVLKSEQKTTRITICEYENYQSNRNANETQMKRKRNASETHLTPNKNENNDKNDKKEGTPDFYNREINDNTNAFYINEYKTFVDLLYGKTDHTDKLENVLRLEKQCSYNSFEKLYQKAKDYKLKISEIIIQMDNKKDLNKKYKSVSQTIHGWLDVRIKK